MPDSTIWIPCLLIFYLIDSDKQRLQMAIPKIRDFLKEELGLTLHPKKICLQPITLPISFLGAVIRPYYRHISSRTTRKFRMVMSQIQPVLRKNPTDEQLKKVKQVVNSYIGYFSHAKAYFFFTTAFDTYHSLKESSIGTTFCVSEV